MCCTKFLKASANNAHVPEGSIEQKIGDYYATCMDTTKIDAAGIHPLDDEIRAHRKNFGSRVAAKPK